jgi:hypothetical protein
VEVNERSHIAVEHVDVLAAERGCCLDLAKSGRVDAANVEAATMRARLTATIDTAASAI